MELSLQVLDTVTAKVAPSREKVRWPFLISLGEEVNPLMGWSRVEPGTGDLQRCPLLIVSTVCL